MTIEERLEKLELNLARARFINRLLAVLCIGAVLSIWFFASGTPTAQEKVMDEVRAKRFVLEDGNGEDRAVMHMVRDEPGLIMFDKSSMPRVMLDVNNNGTNLFLFDKNGAAAACLLVDKDKPSLCLRDKNTKIRIMLAADNYKPGLVLYSSDEKVIWSTP